MTITELTAEQIGNLFNERLEKHFDEFLKKLSSNNANEDLLSREETCKLLQINSSTLWAYTNKGKVTAYGIGNRRYYKRSEVMDSLTKLNK